MGKKGRPTKSVIRENVIEILNLYPKTYGYRVYKIYIEIFPKVTLRSIYYHLHKGITLGEFKKSKASKVKGDYSWGGEAEKIFYYLGPNALPYGNERVKNYFNVTEIAPKKKEVKNAIL